MPHIPFCICLHVVSADCLLPACFLTALHFVSCQIFTVASAQHIQTEARSFKAEYPQDTLAPHLGGLMFDLDNIDDCKDCRLSRALDSHDVPLGMILCLC